MAAGDRDSEAVVNILGIRYEVPTKDRQKLRERLLLEMGQACVDWSNDTGGCQLSPSAARSRANASSRVRKSAFQNSGAEMSSGWYGRGDVGRLSTDMISSVLLSGGLSNG